ncbi:MAG: K(+)-transporting ATPase subunit F [Bacillota bacterium]
MDPWYATGLILSILLFGYLVYVIWNPEKF